MLTPEDPQRFFRLTKGAPLAVVTVLAFTRLPMTNVELQRWTGYAGGTVTQATKLLLDMGWITAQTERGPWCLAEGRQFPNPLEPPPAGAADALAQASALVSPVSSDQEPDSASGARTADADGPALAQDPLLFVQALKGAPASVLLALSFGGGYMSHHDLQLWTRCGHSQITDALRSLGVLGWVSKRSSRGPWILAPGRHLPLSASQKEVIALRALNSDDALLEENLLLKEESLTTSARRKQLIDELLKSGIQEPTASELAELPHVTPAYIQAHVQSARAEGLRVGAAIERMRLASPVPSAPEQARSRREVAREQFRTFMEGKGL